MGNRLSSGGGKLSRYRGASSGKGSKREMFCSNFRTNCERSDTRTDRNRSSRHRRGYREEFEPEPNPNRVRNQVRFHIRLSTRSVDKKRKISVAPAVNERMEEFDVSRIASQDSFDLLSLCMPYNKQRGLFGLSRKKKLKIFGCFRVVGKNSSCMC